MKRILAILVLLFSFNAVAQEKGFSNEEKQSLLEVLHKFEKWQNPDGPTGTLIIYPRVVVITNAVEANTIPAQDSESDTQTGFAIDLMVPVNNYATFSINYFSISNTETVENIDLKFSQNIFQAGLKIHIK